MGLSVLLFQKKPKKLEVGKAPLLSESMALEKGQPLRVVLLLEEWDLDFLSPPPLEREDIIMTFPFLRDGGRGLSHRGLSSPFGGRECLRNWGFLPIHACLMIGESCSL